VYRPLSEVRQVLSRLVRARGLKRISRQTSTATRDVAPRAGAWIETLAEKLPRLRSLVAPRAGAWIETWSQAFAVVQQSASRLVRARGLKLQIESPLRARTPSRLVRARGLKRELKGLGYIIDASRLVRARGLKLQRRDCCAHAWAVAPRAGAWIETSAAGASPSARGGRASCGRVD